MRGSGTASQIIGWGTTLSDGLLIYHFRGHHAAVSLACGWRLRLDEMDSETCIKINTQFTDRWLCRAWWHSKQRPPDVFPNHLIHQISASLVGLDRKIDKVAGPASAMPRRLYLIIKAVLGFRLRADTPCDRRSSVPITCHCISNCQRVRG